MLSGRLIWIFLFKISSTKTLLTYLILFSSWQVFSGSKGVASFQESNNQLAAQTNKRFIAEHFYSTGNFSYKQDKLLNAETNWFENADELEKPVQVFTAFLMLIIFGFSFIHLIPLFLFRFLKQGFPEKLFIRLRVLRL